LAKDDPEGLFQRPHWSNNSKGKKARKEAHDVKAGSVKSWHQMGHRKARRWWRKYLRTDV